MLISEICAASRVPNIPWKFELDWSRQLGGVARDTDIQTDYRNSPPYHGHYACNSFCPTFIRKPLASLGACQSIVNLYQKHKSKPYWSVQSAASWSQITGCTASNCTVKFWNLVIKHTGKVSLNKCKYLTEKNSPLRRLKHILSVQQRSEGTMSGACVNPESPQKERSGTTLHLQQPVSYSADQIQKFPPYALYEPLVREAR